MKCSTNCGRTAGRIQGLCTNKQQCHRARRFSVSFFHIPCLSYPLLIKHRRNPRDLADYIKKLDSDDDLYRSYFTYKNPINEPFEETFQKTWAEPGVELDRGWCGLCRQAARSLQKRKDAEFTLVTPTKSETRPPLRSNIRPRSCAPNGKFNYLAQSDVTVVV